jgi:hydroxymethylpyrimidine pyrophosphatase-like HAD family hydrolase
MPSSSAAPNVVGKVEAASLPVTPATLRDFERRQKRWLRRLTEAPIASVIVDYDGTVCTTDGRFDPPTEPVRAAFLRLLQQGLSVGFVSGRGKSLPISLREWIPRDLQSQVVVGLYNGAIRGSLDDHDTLVADPHGPFTQTAKARRIVRELERIANRYGGRVDVRPFQVSVEPHPSSASLWPAFTKAVDELITRENASESAFKAVRSGHSIDVIPATSSKNLVRKDLTRLQRRHGQTLAVGDRGGVGGNDFELLAFDAFTLSVDEVSGDPTRCWNLAADGRCGPELLTRYLLAIKADRRRIHTFRWSID